MSKIKIGVVQMTSVDDIQINFKMMMGLLSPLKKGEVDVVFFPENCLYMRLREGEKIQGFSINHPAFGAIAEWSSKTGIGVHLGSVPLLDNSVLYNSSVWISPSGEVRSSYRKVHLFDIELEGQKPIRESDVFTHGSGPQELHIRDWHLGQSICYDIRFSDLYHHYATQGVDIILVPSAFLVKTGQAHWDVLLRARAIESQCYIVASAQAGLHQSANGKRETFGHSLVVDPWGQKILEMTESPALAILELDKTHIQKVRSQIPMKNHRRGPFKKS